MSDILVIGSGGAGLAAAIAAHDAGASVTIATKLGVASCNTAKAQGGIQAAVGPDDSVETHFEDLMRSSHDTADPELARILAEEGPATVTWLAEVGRRLPVFTVQYAEPGAAAACLEQVMKEL